jgi:hypothetical protein
MCKEKRKRGEERLWRRFVREGSRKIEEIDQESSSQIVMSRSK